MKSDLFCFLLFIAVMSCKHTLKRNSFVTANEHIRDAESKTAVIITNDEIQKHNCDVIPFNVTIKHKRCIPKTIKANTCSGYCNSLVLPGINGYQNPLRLCKSCKVDKYYWMSVKILCPWSTKKRHRKSKVQITQSCNCMLC